MPDDEVQSRPTAVIFGANGQDGHYLNRILNDAGVHSIGVSRSPGASITGNVTDRALVSSLIREHQPRFIFHLAATSTTRHDALFENHATISTGALNILEAVKNHAPTARVFLSGSGLQFVNTGEPIAETAPFAATSAYAVARIQSTYAARYFRSLGVSAYVGYFFHHDSPRRGPSHMSQVLAQAARRISMGSSETVEIGDLSVRKEYGSANDIMRAVWILLQQDRVFEATIGTGLAYSIADFAEACFASVQLDWRKHVREQKTFKADFSCLVSDPTTIHSLGWSAEVDLQSLAAMMTHAR